MKDDNPYGYVIRTGMNLSAEYVAQEGGKAMVDNAIKSEDLQLWEQIANKDAQAKAKHFSEGKSGVDQIPADVLLEVGKIYAFGEKKYGRDNWKKGTNWSEFYGSALRHIYKFWMRENIDEESRLHHLDHAIWNLITLRYYHMHELGEDSR